VTRVAVYDLYWQTIGGGEQVAGAIAETLAADGQDVTVLGPEPPDIDRLRERLGVDLSNCRYQVAADDAEASAASAEFDVFVNTTYLSRAVSHARRGYYYVHFPQAAPPARRRLRHNVVAAGLRTTRLLDNRWPRRRLTALSTALDRRIDRYDFLESYDRFWANSAFTAEWTSRWWGVAPSVVAPPVRRVQPAPTKESTIANVGRFFDPAHGHSKKQLELVHAFTALESRLAASQWRLALAGGCDPTNREYALSVRRAARGHRISVLVNAPGADVSRLLGEASLYWHAAGYGEDIDRHPHRAEHFGIAVVEAMSAGAVPLVFPVAGPAEIVRHDVDGLHWHTLEELNGLTEGLMRDPDRRHRLSVAARSRAEDYSTERFRTRLREEMAT
jgi:glycosyltransferase involved in cell wall biosynthesis